MPPTTKQNIFAQQKLESVNDQRFTWRERVTAAQINAGYTILPVVPGYKYRISYMVAIAVGGAATTATDVRVLGTRAAAVVALLITAIAALTQSAWNAPGVANNTILADGASFTELDINTAITVGKTGGNLAGATAVDFIIDYTLVKA
jgi:hypothetical protein